MFSRWRKEPDLDTLARMLRYAYVRCRENGMSEKDALLYCAEAEAQYRWVASIRRLPGEDMA